METPVILMYIATVAVLGGMCCFVIEKIDQSIKPKSEKPIVVPKDRKKRESILNNRL